MGDLIRTRVVKNGLPAIRKKAPERLHQIHDETADLIVKIQKQLVPVSASPPEGHTHIRDTIQKVKDGKRIAVTEGDSEHTYGPHLEFGTDSMIARPHARPAAAEGRKFRDAKIKELAREIGK
jgi:hypothetical protein